MPKNRNAPFGAAMDELLKNQDKFPILATSSRALDFTRVLKQGDTFAVFDRHGDIQPEGIGEQGLFHKGTRHLSRFVLLFEQSRPLLLSSGIAENNAFLEVDLTNPDSIEDGRVVLPRNSIHIARTTFLWEGVCFTRLRIRNFTMNEVDVNLAILFAADYADIFEVRGSKRRERGKFLAPEIRSCSIMLGYEGLDHVVRRTSVSFQPDCTYSASSYIRFGAVLPSLGEETYFVTVSCEAAERSGAQPTFDAARSHVETRLEEMVSGEPGIRSSNDQFNQWIRRSRSDLHMMITRTASGTYPYAGIPWFSTPFGRDGIITALEYLWVNPMMARGVLQFLAENQARDFNPEQDAQPGKIVHEIRAGEMAALKEIPFGKYYGTVDATPLFVMLAGAYLRRTGDLDFIRRIWPNIDLALGWISGPGDPDGDGFVEYHRESSQGLIAQGWKDSFDAVFHKDGTLVEGPVALCEVQAYCFAARLSAAEIAEALGIPQKPEQLRQEAEQLRIHFDQAYWVEELSTYAIALDGKKRRCLVRASNAGHCLFGGIASPERARAVADTLTDRDCFSGWGIRTVADGEARYNPMSYHNGSVWPHDNALITSGMARYGFRNEVQKLFTGIFEASLFVELNRMPELFCGFPRLPWEGPTLYPVACSPQSWAAGAVFMMLQACLGLEIDALNSEVRLVRPALPLWLEALQIHDLEVGDASIDLSIEHLPRDVGVNLMRRTGDVRVVIVK
jgi:glycogen debranching enzyme